MIATILWDYRGGRARRRARQRPRAWARKGSSGHVCCCLLSQTIITFGLQGSSTEAREAAAEGLGEMVSVTSQDALKPFVVQITGPLIRIIGDRFPSQVCVRVRVRECV